MDGLLGKSSVDIRDPCGLVARGELRRLGPRIHGDFWVTQGAAEAKGRVCWTHAVGNSEGLSLRISGSKVEMLHDVSEGKTFVRWVTAWTEGC